MMSNAAYKEFTPLFEPKTVAVVGASTKGGALPNVFIKRIQTLGFKGPIYPIHPTANSVSLTISGIEEFRLKKKLLWKSDCQIPFEPNILRYPLQKMFDEKLVVLSDDIEYKNVIIPILQHIYHRKDRKEVVEFANQL